MAEDELERPLPKGPSGWPTLYRTRGTEVGPERPIFTGDVFALGDGSRHVQLLQHPCALRVDGVQLLERLLVADVASDDDEQVPQVNWKGFYRMMPLPALTGNDSVGLRHFFADFDALDVVGRADIENADRIACLSQSGVNLLVQRWLHHNSRVVVPTFRIQEVTGGPYDEADLIEEWCEESMSPVQTATSDALEWLRQETSDGLTRQRALAVAQNRSGIRQDMRKHLRSLSPRGLRAD